LKIGLVRLFWVALFGVVIPYGASRLNRRIGAPLLLLLAAATGFGYAR